MQFQIPQFETENKIFGPFNILQFAVIFGSVIISFLLFNILENWLWFITSGLIIGSSLILSLGKINGRPMFVFLKGALNYFWEPHIFIFKTKEEVSLGLKNIVLPEAPQKISLQTKKIPSPETLIPTTEVIQAPLIAVTQIPHPQSFLGDLFGKITTTKNPIPQREVSLKKAGEETRDEFETIRKITGETESARRVDYR